MNFLNLNAFNVLSWLHMDMPMKSTIKILPCMNTEFTPTKILMSSVYIHLVATASLNEWMNVNLNVVTIVNIPGHSCSIEKVKSFFMWLILLWVYNCNLWLKNCNDNSKVIVITTLESQITMTWKGSIIPLQHNLINTLQ